MNLMSDDARRCGQLQVVALNTDVVFSLKNYDVVTLALGEAELHGNDEDDGIDDSKECFCSASNMKLIL